MKPGAEGPSWRWAKGALFDVLRYYNPTQVAKSMPLKRKLVNFTCFSSFSGRILGGF
jgi:hypothetical protein